MSLIKVKKKLQELEIPDSIQMSPAQVVVNPKRFIDSHISILENNSGNKTFLPYYYRLVRFVRVVEKMSQ